MKIVKKKEQESEILDFIIEVPKPIAPELITKNSEINNFIEIIPVLSKTEITKEFLIKRFALLSHETRNLYTKYKNRKDRVEKSNYTNADCLEKAVNDLIYTQEMLVKLSNSLKEN